MEVIKILLLVIAYTLGIAALILQIVCYLKDLEYMETIFFTSAFLLLIVAMTLQGLIRIESQDFMQFRELATNLLIVLFAVSIPVNVHKERTDSLRMKRNRVVFVTGTMVATLTTAFYLLNCPVLTFFCLFSHLFLSVVYSMLFILSTKPEPLIRYREKTERLIAVIVLIIMLVSFVLVSVHAKEDSLNLLLQNGGFVLALVCIILSVSKISGDFWKLIHRETFETINEDKFERLGITRREREVLLLLITGKTYREIAAELFISLPTVKTHVSNIYSKTSVRNKLELAKLITQDSDK